jgi:CubicO group peptidase (beta-lactamase class C family)
MRSPLHALALVLLLAIAFCTEASAQKAVVSPDAVVWSPVELTFEGPKAAAGDSAPNPFLDYRLTVTFEGPKNLRFEVPGFFDGDGAGGLAGLAWRVRFTPSSTGEWRYRASFRQGPAVAIDPAADAGVPAAFDDASGSFRVEPYGPDTPDFLRWGRLKYAGGHYLKFENGPYWIKGGTDEPENFLAYAGFVNTPGSHGFVTHVQDWRPGDPDWNEGAGRGIIGALNYLSRMHVNSIYFLTMNVGGDGKDVWPWLGKPNPKGAPSNDNLHFDLAKLRQWETVFAHAQRQGIALHFVFNEAEKGNKRELDDGELGPERKLYYREIIARFGHHNALQWNLCEEYNLDFDFGPDRVRAFASEIRRLDPYDHPITVHSAGDPLKQLAFTFGDPLFDVTSVQLNQRRIDLVTEAVRKATAAAGRPLPAHMDEFTVDVGQKQSHIPSDDAERQRREKLWPTYLSGGSIEFILEGLLDAGDFRTPAREALWRYVWNARKFMQELPFWEMEPADELASGGETIVVGMGGGKSSQLGPQVFALKGRVYAVYFPSGKATGTLDLTGESGDFERLWYDPRAGTFEGEPALTKGGGPAALGPVPKDPDADWVALVRRKPDTSATVFPGKAWESRSPAELGLNGEKLLALERTLAGRGCVVKNGYVVAAWGDQSVRSDWYSSAKPVLSTLLLFAVKESRVSGVDQPIAEFGWALKPKDRAMTFRHLGTMTSGYARPEKPGEAWAYNDFAIQLYQKTLFDKVFREDPDAVANSPKRFGRLGLEDGLSFSAQKNRRLKASVRDFARIAWLWANQGRWSDEELIPRPLFTQHVRPMVPRDLPQTARAETDDDLGIGSYGGGSDHFTKAGPGMYGMNWWFNAEGRTHPGAIAWPDAPADLFMSLGFGGNNAAISPSDRAVLVTASGDWGQIEPGRRDSKMNRVLQAFHEAVAPSNETRNVSPAR